MSAVEASREVLAAAEGAVLEARRELVLAALRAHRGNRSAAAAELGMSRRQLQRLLLDLDLVAELDAAAAAEGWLDGPGPAVAALRGRARARVTGG